MTNKRAKEMVDDLTSHGVGCGFLVMANTVVMRCPGSPYTDTPTIYDKADLDDAIASGLLRKQKIVGSFEWEYYVAADMTAKEKFEQHKKNCPRCVEAAPGQWNLCETGQELLR